MISDRQKIACQLLAAGQSGREVAKTISVHESTISNWRRTLQFQKELANAQVELISELRSRLLRAADVAITNLVRVSAQHDDLASSVAASKSILSNCRLIPESGGGLSGADLAAGSPEDLPECLQQALGEIETFINGGEASSFVRHLEREGLIDDAQAREALTTDMGFLNHQLECWREDLAIRTRQNSTE